MAWMVEDRSLLSVLRIGLIILIRHCDARAVLIGNSTSLSQTLMAASLFSISIQRTGELTMTLRRSLLMLQKATEVLTYALFAPRLRLMPCKGHTPRYTRQMTSSRWIQTRSRSLLRTSCYLSRR